jgi:hypothetical protein
MRSADLSSIEIASLSDLEHAISETAALFEWLFPLWRGHACNQWPLQAEVFRLASDGKPYQEVSLLRSFMAHAESRSPRCPDSDDLVGWLMLARHFGLPTRLLDWSHSALVGLYFAAQDHGEADGCLWAIEPGRLNLQMMGDRRFLAPDEAMVKELVEIAFEPSLEQRNERTSRVAGRALAIGTREIDPRIFIQQGAFTIHSDAQDLADVDFKYPNGAARPAWRRAFRIPRAAKKQVRDLLRALGIYESVLFPDLATLAKELKFRPYLQG